MLRYNKHTYNSLYTSPLISISDLPKNCDEVRTYSKVTGEYLIWPTTSVEPFIVLCDMNIVPGRGGHIIIFTLPSLIYIQTHLGDSC